MLWQILLMEPLNGSIVKRALDLLPLKTEEMTCSFISVKSTTMVMAV